MIYICCVGFASLDIVCDALYDCICNVVACSSFLISVYFAHIECYSECSRRNLSQLVEPLFYGDV